MSKELIQAAQLVNLADIKKEIKAGTKVSDTKALEVVLKTRQEELNGDTRLSTWQLKSLPTVICYLAITQALELFEKTNKTPNTTEHSAFLKKAREDRKLIDKGNEYLAIARKTSPKKTDEIFAEILTDKFPRQVSGAEKFRVETYLSSAKKVFPKSSKVIKTRSAQVTTANYQSESMSSPEEGTKIPTSKFGKVGNFFNATASTIKEKATVLKDAINPTSPESTSISSTPNYGSTGRT